VPHQDIIKAIIRLLNNYTVDAFDHQQIPIGVPTGFDNESKSFQQKTNLHIEQNFTDISRELFQIKLVDNISKRSIETITTKTSESKIIIMYIAFCL